MRKHLGPGGMGLLISRSSVTAVVYWASAQVAEKELAHETPKELTLLSLTTSEGSDSIFEALPFKTTGSIFVSSLKELMISASLPSKRAQSISLLCRHVGHTVTPLLFSHHLKNTALACLQHHHSTTITAVLKAVSAL